MTYRFTLSTLAAGMCVAAAAAPASAQFEQRRPAIVLAHASTTPQADVHGTVLDNKGHPLAGAVISAFGSATVFAVSDPDGRYAFRNVPYGPYLVRAHLQGYTPPRARVVQVNRSSLTVAAIALTRHPAESEAVPVLAAGVAGSGVAATAGSDDDDTDTHDHGEVAWRLRHLKRSVLRDAAIGLLPTAVDEPSFLDAPLANLGRAFGTSAKLASLFAEVPWNGHIDLLTSASFDRPAELLSTQSWPPRGGAFLALEAPTTSGHWTMNGAVTQGDLSSWIVAASFRRAPATHRYEAGLTYGTQWSFGRHGLSAPVLSDGGRNAGGVYAYDEWAVSSKLTLSYGAKFARYDYLAGHNLFSPRASVTLTPTSDETFKLRAAVSRRLMAPGAEEFMPPTMGVWVPPERTFSALSARAGLTPERLDHVEIAVERAWVGDVVVGVRGFRQDVDDQLVTLFGAAPRTSTSDLSHYYMASAGDFDARGWTVSVSHTVAEHLKASIDYSQVHAAWRRRSDDTAVMPALAIAAPHDDRERLQDITTSIASSLPVTATRVFVLYKLNSRFANLGPAKTSLGARFDLQVSQGLPFLSVGGAEWEMLVAVRSLFREELFDTSVYDEVFVVRPPKRVVGGVTVRF
jgi:hypothetical protein